MRSEYLQEIVTVCFPNETDELARIKSENDDAFLRTAYDLLYSFPSSKSMKLPTQLEKPLGALERIAESYPRSPRAKGGAQSPAISLPVAGAGIVGSQYSFDRDTQATGV